MNGRPYLISAEDLFTLEGKSLSTVRRALKANPDEVVRLTKHEAKEKGAPWGKSGGGKEGRRPFVSLYSRLVSESARNKYLARIAATDVDRAPGCPSALSGTSFESGDGYTVPAPLSSGSPDVPEKAKAEAGAKADLVAVWRGYREGNRKGRKLSEVDEEFQQAYNTGYLLPTLFSKLGPVDVKSLYRWASKLGDTLDWTLLVPAWHYGKGEPGLTDAEKTLFLDCLLQPNRLNIGEATRTIKAVLKRRNIPSPSSPMSFRRYAHFYMAKNSHIWTVLREGEKALKDTQVFSIKRDSSKLEVGQVLIADGHRLNFQVNNPFTGKPCRATLVGYLDWRSGALAGFDIMVEENVQVVASALRQAIIRLQKFPEFVLTDNGKAFRAKFFTSTKSLQEAGLCGLYGRLNITPVFAAPYSARSKPIERTFKEFAKFERLLLSFTGTSILDKPAWMKRNEKFHRALHRGEIPTIEQTVDMVNIWIESYYEEQPHPHIKGKTIGQVFNEGKGPGVDIAALDDLMLAHEVKRVGPNGIRFLGADYYDDAFVGIREKVIVKYAITDLTSVRVYDTDGCFLCTAKRFDSVHPLAAQLGSAKDLAEVRHLQNKQKSIARATIRIAKETKELLSERKKALPWADIIEAVPRIVDQLEKADVELPALEEHIPEEAVRREQPLPAPIRPLPTEPPAQPAERHPTFYNDTDKYLWLAEHGIEEADKDWLDDFKQSDSYRLLRDHLDAMERKYAADRSHEEAARSSPGGAGTGRIS
jgi:putative transposase